MFRRLFFVAALGFMLLQPVASVNAGMELKGGVPLDGQEYRPYECLFDLSTGCLHSSPAEPVLPADVLQPTYVPLPTTLTTAAPLSIPGPAAPIHPHLLIRPVLTW